MNDISEQTTKLDDFSEDLADEALDRRENPFFCDGIKCGSGPTRIAEL